MQLLRPDHPTSALPGDKTGSTGGRASSVLSDLTSRLTALMPRLNGLKSVAGKMAEGRNAARDSVDHSKAAAAAHVALAKEAVAVFRSQLAVAGEPQGDAPPVGRFAALRRAADACRLHVRTTLSSSGGVAKGDRLKSDRKPYAAYAAYLRAAEAGSLEAKLRLADMHEKGIGTQLSLPHALAWYQAAAADGSVEADYRAGKCLLNMEDAPRGVRSWYQAAAEKSPHRADELGKLFGVREAAEDTFATARTHLRRAASNGHSDAAFLLAELIARGRGGEQSDRDAVPWFRQAAEAGNAGAAYGLGEMYRLGKGVRRDEELALMWLRKAGDGGHIPAQALVGEILFRKRVPRTEREIYSRLSAAAKQNYAPAQFALAAVHATVDGKYHDLAKARELLLAAAKAGFLPAILKAAEALSGPNWGPPDPVEAAKWYRLGADAGDKNSQFFVGRMYATGEGVPKVLSSAVRWFRRAAEAGHAIAQYNLGIMLERGDGVDKDASEALHWFGAAAKQGLDVAQFKVALALLQGTVVSQDHVAAVNWLECAADQGHAEAATLLAQIYARRETPPPDFQKATVLLEKAIAAGHAPAMTHLGAILLRTREGAPKAIEWYQAAAEAGQIDAEYALAMLYLEGKAVPADTAQAMHWLTRAASHGHVNATFQLGIMYCAGDKIPRDVQKGCELYLAAARAGHLVAKYNYAIMMSGKYGIKGDKDAAMQFLREAADGGLPEARKLLDSIEAQQAVSASRGV